MCRLLAVSATALVLVGCLRSKCTNEVRQELLSPDGTKKIVVFSRECGVTTGFNTQASLLDRTEDLPDERGNVFVIDKGAARVSWRNDSTVVVVLDEGARVFEKHEHVRGVRIEYHEERKG